MRSKDATALCAPERQKGLRPCSPNSVRFLECYLVALVIRMEEGLGLNHQTKATSALERKLKTCFRFPLDGRAFVANLQMNMRRRRISAFVILIFSKYLPPSNDPSSSKREIRIAKQIHTLISSPLEQHIRSFLPSVNFDLAKLTAEGRLFSKENRSNFEFSMGQCIYDSPLLRESQSGL